MKKILISIVVIIIVAAIGGYFLIQKQSPTAPTTQTTPSQSPTTQPVQLSETAKTIFAGLPASLQGSMWQAPIASNITTSYGNAAGYLENGSLTTQTASVSPFENKQQLTSLGFSEDNNLAAGGPGSSLWGYKKTIGNEIQLIIYSYKTDPTSSNPNEPLQFNCPCQTNVSVFVSNPFTPTTN